MEVGSVLIDFDGTACPLDVFIEICRRFVGDDWERYFESAGWKGTSTLRADMVRLARLLDATTDEMLAFIIGRVRIDPGLVRFVEWAQAEGAELAIVSDGLGFYIRPMLEVAGLSHLPVVTNALVDTPHGRVLHHPFGHPRCRGCGTCKMLAVLSYQERGRSVAFIGDGNSDRFAALYADVVFAKEGLAQICAADGVPFEPWRSFDDVRETLVRKSFLTQPRAPEVCPGWTFDGGSI